MSILKKFQHTCDRLFRHGDHLLLAVSGGLDSVVLCDLCMKLGMSVTIVHCNFQLRGEESERDKKFVTELGRNYGITVLTRDFDTLEFSRSEKMSIQEAARKLRYEWFDELLNNSESENAGVIKPKWLLTAHHADDNIETLLINFFRGTGIQGLRGMKEKQGKIIRPLLDFRRQELAEYANENALTWVEDSSNAMDKYTRNYFRHNIIPLIREKFPDVEKNLQSNLKRFTEIESLYQDSVSRQVRDIVEHKEEELHIPVLKLLKSPAPSTIIFEIIKVYGFTAHQVEEVMNLLNSETGAYLQSSTHRVIKNRNWLIISPRSAEQSAHIIVEDVNQVVSYLHGSIGLKMENRNGIISTQREIAQLDAKNIAFPLLLRPWKTGDYFYPLGMKKKKKLSRFFIDQKLSKTEKEKIWVVESDKKILWIVGYRIDERFKVADNTRQVLTLTFNNSRNNTLRS